MFLGTPATIYEQRGNHPKHMISAQNQLVPDMQNPEMMAGLQNNNQHSFDHQEELQKEGVEPNSMMSELFVSQTQNAAPNTYQVNYEQNAQTFGIITGPTVDIQQTLIQPEP